MAYKCHLNSRSPLSTINPGRDLGNLSGSFSKLNSPNGPFSLFAKQAHFLTVVSVGHDDDYYSTCSSF